jgi:Mor family transcriptional regulator
MANVLILDAAYPEVLADIAREIHARLMDDPRVKLPHQVAAEIALGVAEHVRRNIGGVSLYIPRGHAYEATQREQQIYRDFKGDNYQELARQYDLTEMRIRQIVNQVGAVERAKRQQNLFEPA